MQSLNICEIGIKSLRDYFEEHPEHSGVTYLDCRGNQLTKNIKLNLYLHFQI
jgi:hypothetical protein